MSEALANFIGLLTLSFTGFFAIKKIICSKEKLNLKRIILLIIIAIISQVLLKIKNTGVYTIVIFLLNIVMYKYIFNIAIEESFLATSIFMGNMFLTDLITAGISSLFIPVNEARKMPIVIISANICVCLFLFGILKIKPVLNQYRKFYLNNKKGITIMNILFLALLVIGFSLLGYNIAFTSSWSHDYITNTVVMIIFMIIAFVYIENRNKYNQLTYEYDNLFSYVQTFEEWIEREQFNRHEYKNQLAVLRYLSKEKKIKEKIDEILKDNINLEGDAVNNLKNLPKGGIKGLMYYKAIVAQKNKVKLSIDASIKENSKLRLLSEQNNKDLCKLIGVYFDNAIEAAIETRKKQILIEIYETNNQIKFVFSNTFKKHKNFDKRNEKDVTTKGNGHGKGLYLASKLIAKNNWIKENQKVVDNYYIQELILDMTKPLNK